MNYSSQPRASPSPTPKEYTHRARHPPPSNLKGRPGSFLPRPHTHYHTSSLPSSSPPPKIHCVDPVDAAPKNYITDATRSGPWRRRRSSASARTVRTASLLSTDSPRTPQPPPPCTASHRAASSPRPVCPTNRQTPTAETRTAPRTSRHPPSTDRTAPRLRQCRGALHRRRIHLPARTSTRMYDAMTRHRTARRRANPARRRRHPRRSSRGTRGASGPWRPRTRAGWAPRPRRLACRRWASRRTARRTRRRARVRRRTQTRTRRLKNRRPNRRWRTETPLEDETRKMNRHRFGTRWRGAIVAVASSPSRAPAQPPRRDGQSRRRSDSIGAPRRVETRRRICLFAVDAPLGQPGPSRNPNRHPLRPPPRSNRRSSWDRRVTTKC